MEEKTDDNVVAFTQKNKIDANEIRAKAEVEYQKLTNVQKNKLNKAFKAVTEDDNNGPVMDTVIAINQLFVDLFDKNKTAEKKVDTVSMFQIFQRSMYFVGSSMFANKEEYAEFLTQVRYDVTEKLMPAMLKDGNKNFIYFSCLSFTLLEYLVLNTRMDFYEQNAKDAQSDAAPTQEIDVDGDK